jgi:hypothetical protein
MRRPPPFPEGRPREFTVTVHGTVFGGRDRYLADLSEGDRLQLMPDPPVQEEPEVWVHLRTGEPIGHLPPEVGEWLAPWLQRGGHALARALKVHGADAPSWRRLVIEVTCRPVESPGRA